VLAHCGFDFVESLFKQFVTEESLGFGRGFNWGRRRYGRTSE
jgi:hypothetical protein